MNLAEMELLVFESPLSRNHEPLSLTRPAFDFLLGARTLLERTESSLEKKASNLIVPKHLSAITKERHPGCQVNADSSSLYLAVNSLVSPGYDLAKEVKGFIASLGKNFAIIDSKKNVIFSVLEGINGKDFEIDLSKVQKKLHGSSGNPFLEFPWQTVSENHAALEQDYEFFRNSNSSLKDPQSSNGAELLGSKNIASEDSEIGRFVTMDSRSGPVIIDAGATVQSNSHLSGPCYIGKSTIVKSARIRAGTSIGRDCRVGGEVESTIINDYSNKSHEGFLGHSIVGSWVNLGALTTNSDLKNTYGSIKANVAGKIVDTHSIKVGCFLSDMCKTSIGVLLFSGKSVGVCSNVFGEVSMNVPSFTFYSDSGSSREMYLASAIETQARMMERRKISMSEGFKHLIESVFKITSKERRAARVRPGKFRI